MMSPVAGVGAACESIGVGVGAGFWAGAGVRPVSDCIVVAVVGVAGVAGIAEVAELAGVAGVAGIADVPASPCTVVAAELEPLLVLVLVEAPAALLSEASLCAAAFARRP